MEQPTLGLRRRDLVASAAAAGVSLALGARRGWAQDRPVIGFLSSLSRQDGEAARAAFLAGLGAGGFRDGATVAIEYRWAEGRYDRLAALAADLVERRVTVIATHGGTNSALAAKAATTTIPIVFVGGNDPIEAGLVRSLSRPEANLTGVVILQTQLLAKRLELLNELLPGAAPLGALDNPANSNTADSRKFIDETAKRLGRRVIIQDASRQSDFAPAFIAWKQQGAAGADVSGDGFIAAYASTLAALAAQHALPAIGQGRDFPAAGGLMSYSAPPGEAYRQAGLYVAKILRGARAGDLPVMQAEKFDFVINLKTAKTLGLTFPLTLLGRADDVIE